jgi:hypothetical protein
MRIITVGSYQWGRSLGVLNFKCFDIDWATGNWYARRWLVTELVLGLSNALERKDRSEDHS